MNWTKSHYVCIVDLRFSIYSLPTNILLSNPCFIFQKWFCQVVFLWLGGFWIGLTRKWSRTQLCTYFQDVWIIIMDSSSNKGKLIPCKNSILLLAFYRSNKYVSINFTVVKNKQIGTWIHKVIHGKLRYWDQASSF